MYSFLVINSGVPTNQDESLYNLWTRFKDIIQKVPNHDLSIWTLIEIFLKHLDSLSRHIINLTTEGDLRKFSDIGAWYAIKDCAQYDKKSSNPTSVISDKTIANPNAQIVGDDMVRVQGLESKEVSPLGKELSLFDRPNEVERGRILEAHRLEPILRQQISQHMAPSHHNGCYAAFCTGKQLIRMSAGIFSSKTKNEFSQSVEMASRFTRDAITATLVTGLDLTRRSLEDLRMFSLNDSWRAI
ncbi:hypothetical protein Tco_0763921 [Tanacetum coccineum]